MSATRPNITSLSDDIKYWNILLYGDSGVGKTVFSGSDTKVLFVAPEDDGLISSQRINAAANSSKITVATWEDMKNTYEWFEDHPEELDAFNAVCIDSITEMQRLAKEYVLRMGADEKVRKQRDPEKMELQDYGIMHELLENLVRGFNDLPVNVLWTATAKKVEDADGNEFLVPELQGKKDYGISMKMVALMTSYGYMRTEIHEVPDPTPENPEQVKNVKVRVIYWEDTGTIRGKDRTTSLAPFTVNMTLQQMRRAIAGGSVRNDEGRIVKTEMVAANTRARTPRKASPQKVNAVESEPDDKLAKNDSDPISAVNDSGEKEGEIAVELDDINA